jgi:hypothetical protein
MYKKNQTLYCAGCNNPIEDSHAFKYKKDKSCFVYIHAQSDVNFKKDAIKQAFQVNGPTVLGSVEIEYCVGDCINSYKLKIGELFDMLRLELTDLINL